MQNVATSIAGIIIVLGFLVFAHESGHFLVAKLFRVRVLVFSLGFGKRLFGFRKGATDYRVSLVPLGGYVRMAGDTPEENQPANPEEFLSKPKWQRFLILVAGPFMNIVIAIAFMAGIFMMGTETAVVGTVISSLTPGKPGALAGLKPGDQIVAINGETINEFDDMKMAISIHAGTALRVEYLRGGVRHTTTLTPERENTDLGPIGRAWIVPYQPTIIGVVLPDSPAARAGLRPGDRIVAANGRPTPEYPAFGDVFTAAKEGPIELEVQRGAGRFRTMLSGAPIEEGKGFRGFGGPVVVRKFSAGAAIQESVRQNWKMLRYAFITLGRLFRAEGSVKELSGPISIARISGEVLRRGLLNTIALMAMISLQLGVMNLLPIPVLDGGHIMILLVEGVARRDLSLRVKERIQQVGFAVLATLMVVVLYNDVITNVMRRG